MNPFHAALVLALIFIEWMDFSLYLYLAKDVFSKEFFPPSHHSLTLTFAIFGVAYLARPLGGWWLGRMADRKGRRLPMLYSSLLMGGATLGIALLPGYAYIGFMAPWLLLVFRIAQGFALGGEVNTASMYLIESYPSLPLLSGGLCAGSGALGMFAGGFLAAWVHTAGTGLWRSLFAVAGIAGLLLYFLRKRLTESPEYQSSRPKGIKIWRMHRQGLLCVITTAAFVSVMVYLCNVFWVSFAHQNGLWPQISLPLVAAFAQFGSALLAIPLIFRLEERQVAFLMQSSFFCIILAASALFYGSAHLLSGWVVFGLLMYVSGNACLCAGLYYYLYLQVPAYCRCFSVSALWAVAASFGALSLPLSQSLLQAGYFYFAPVCIIVCALSAWAALYQSPMFPQQQLHQDVFFKSKA